MMGEKCSCNSSVVTPGTRRDCDGRFEVACGRCSHCSVVQYPTRMLESTLKQVFSVWVRIVMLTPTIEAISLEERVNVVKAIRTP